MFLTPEKVRARFPDGKDPHPCSGMMTKHHVHYKCEGGADKPNNLVLMCQGHQRFVHSKDMWGDESFAHLKRRYNGES